MGGDGDLTHFWKNSGTYFGLLYISLSVSVEVFFCVYSEPFDFFLFYSLIIIIMLM